MPDVKFTLTTEEQQTLAKLRQVDSEFGNIDASAKKAGQSIANVDALLGRLSKSVNFHGSRSAKSIAGDMLGRVDPSVAGALLRGQAVRQARAGDANGLRAEVQRLRSKMENDAGYTERAASVQAAIDRRIGGDRGARNKDRAALGKFIQSNALGDGSDPLTQLAARIVRSKVQAVDRVMADSLRAVGGNTDLLHVAKARGVAVGDPAAMRDFVARRAREAEESVAQGVNNVAADRRRERIAARYAYARSAVGTTAEGERYSGTQNFQRPEGRSFSAGPRRSALDAGYSVADHEATRARREALRGQLRAQRVVGFAEANLSADASASVADDAIKQRRVDRIWKRQELRKGRFDREAADVARDENRQRIADVFDEADQERAVARDRTNLRASRVREVRDLRARRRAAVGDAIGAGVSTVAGAAAGAIYAGEQVLGNYNERMGSQYFSAVAGIEPTFREVMGQGDNAGQQKQLRQKITDSAIAYGQPIGAASSFYYDIFSAAGNLPQKKQDEIIKSALQFQNVAGGELPIIGQAMTTMQQLYGPQVGSVDRMSSIIKKTIDYGKFSPTGFAKLSPEAFSAASLYGVPMEEAAAMMGVVSNRSGRDENMFTGSRYTFAMMGKAADAGLVDRKSGFLEKLRQLKKASPNQLKETFGMEGLNVVSNARDMIDDIDKLATQLKGMNGTELGQQQQELIKDPVNAISRFAQSADIASGNILPSLIQSGGPEGMKLAGEAILTRLKMAGQSALSPDIASLTDITKNTDLQLRGDKYLDVGMGAIEAALAKQDDPAMRHGLQIARIAAGKVQVGREFSANVDNPRPKWNPIMSTAADIGDYEKMAGEDGLSSLTADEFGGVKTAREHGDEAAAQEVLATARKRGAATAAAMPGQFPGMAKLLLPALGSAASVMGGMLPASATAAMKHGAATVAKFLPSASQMQDLANRSTIRTTIRDAETSLAAARESGDVYGADAAKFKLRGIRDRRRELTYDADGFTATDRRTLVEEINGGGGNTATAMDAAVTKFANSIDTLVAALGGRAGAATPTTQPSSVAPATRKQSPATQPSIRVDP